MITSMITTLELKEGDKSLYLYCDEHFTPKHIWKDIKETIKYVKDLSKWDYDYKERSTLVNNLYDWMILLSGYYVNSSNIFNIKYKCYVESRNNSIIFEVKNSENLICFKDILLYNTNKDIKGGNCIDDFIKRGVDSRLILINNSINSIKSRIEDRTNVIEYHQTDCYEKDFSDILTIKYQAQKIVDNCNKHLERISEKYTKIN